MRCSTGTVGVSAAVVGGVAGTAAADVWCSLADVCISNGVKGRAVTNLEKRRN